MSNDHSTSFNTPFCISTIDISLARDSRKTVESITLISKTGELSRNIQTTLRAGDRYREEFNPPLVVKSDNYVSVSVGCSSQFRKRFGVVININLRNVECMRDDEGIKSYRKKTRNVEVVVAGYQFGSQVSGLVPPTSSLVPPVSNELLATTTELSGVGKSALIRKMFGVEEVVGDSSTKYPYPQPTHSSKHVSKTAPGAAKIDQEFISRTNERFVMHDSLGFEAGDERNIEIVKGFVRRRQAMLRLEDRLHAIWLCVEIPYSGGRLADAGVEQFLQCQRDAIGNSACSATFYDRIVYRCSLVPLVIVLTKVDLLDIQLRFEVSANETLGSCRSNYLEEHCIRPLCEAAGHEVTPVAVSIRARYSESLSNLLKATMENMAKYNIDEAPRAMASIAQRVNIKEKIEWSITIGKKKYWQTLLKSAFFRGRTLKECLEVIRKDIITVWNFYDPDQCLMDDKLIGVLLCTDNLRDPSISYSTMDSKSFATSLASGLELAKGLPETGDNELTVADSAASIAVAALRMMCNEYQELKDDVKIFMAYIVDLICVMQAIFVIAPNGQVTPETVALVLQAYEVPRKNVHVSIEGFDRKQCVLPRGRDQVLEEIEALIWCHSISDHEMGQLRQRVGSMSSSSTL
ncbi:hypothetical protein JVU11DRAFT_10022 [Chiua virens]|nr:hypothetical protein JVU11DRAFT_10022 [Chiua virens]